MNSHKSTVLITNTVPPNVLEPLDGLAHVIQGPPEIMSRADVLKLAPMLDGIINQGELAVDAELLDHAPRLKIVANVAVGYNNFDVELMASRGVWATNSPNIFAESTADCTLALLLAVARMVVRSDQYIRSGKWKRFEPGMWDGVLLAGTTLGIVGYGQIGQAVARRAQAFGMNIIYTRRSQDNHPACRSLDALLAESDFVSLHTPLLPETHHLIDTDQLRAMKPGAYLINMARGPVLNEAALVETLQSGHLAGAGLDVFEREPEVHPALLTMDNVVMTPHIGGGTTRSRYESRYLCARNIAAVLQGERPITPVNEVIIV